MQTFTENEVTRIQSLLNAAKKVLWKLERKEMRTDDAASLRWARIDRNDATINELRRAVEGTA